MRRFPLFALLGLTAAGCSGGAAAPMTPAVPAAESVPGATRAHATAPRREAESAAHDEEPAGTAGSIHPSIADEPLAAPIVERWTPPTPAAPPISARGSMWGSEVPDAALGGLGLSGVGEGSGGSLDGIGLGAVGTLGHGAGSGDGGGRGSTSGRGSGSPRGAGPAASLGATGAGVRAGEWDDNANFREFRRYVEHERALGFERADLSVRRFVVVRDTKGKGVPNCPVSIRDGVGREVILRTASSGRALLFPRAEGLGTPRLTASAKCDAAARPQTFFTHLADDGVVELSTTAARVLPESPTVDVVFVVDTTGSMSEEIRALGATIARVAEVLSRGGIAVRVGLVEYRDRGDEFVTRTHPMTRDLAGFAARVRELRAQGGGDTPEDVNAGLAAAIRTIEWRPDAVARLGFLLGDAPPHLEYEQTTSYALSARRAAHEGIQLFTIAASGMDDLGQAVWRQVAQYTGATNMFILRGGAGPQSVGGGDPKSSCGGTQTSFTTGNLDRLITDKVERAVAAIDADPLRVAGLGQDENAKPCDQRVR